LHAYKKLYDPIMAAPHEYFSSVPRNLFDKVIKQYSKANSWLHDF
jgi:hypothetical protein